MRVAFLIAALSFFFNLNAQNFLLPSSIELQNEIKGLSKNRSFLLEEKEMPIGLRTISWFIEFMKSYGEDVFFEPGFWSYLDQMFCRIPTIPRKLVLLSEETAPSLHKIVQSVAVQTSCKKPIILMVDDTSYDYLIGTCSFGWGKSLLVFGKKALLSLPVEDLCQYTAHEMGHLCLYHSAKRELSGYTASLLGKLGILFGVAYSIKEPLSLHQILLIAVLMFIGPKIVTSLSRYAARGVRRGHEFEADRFAVNLLNDNERYIESLNKIYQISSQEAGELRKSFDRYAAILLEKAQKNCSKDTYEYIKELILIQVASMSEENLSAIETQTHLSLNDRINHLFS